LAAHDGAVMSACAGPAPDQRGMLTGMGRKFGEVVCLFRGGRAGSPPNTM